MGPFPHDAPKARISAENPAGTDGFEFVEFAHPEPEKLDAIFRQMGFVPVARGEIRLLGMTVREALRRNLVAYVPQSEEVDWTFPVLVEDVVMMGRYGHMGFLRRPAPADRAAVETALARVGMQDYRLRQIGELSGGQKKRVFLARALAQDGRVILLDEPFTGVDVKTEEQIVALLGELRAEGRVMLVSTHNLGSVPEFCDRVVLVKGTVLAYGPTETTFTRKNLEAAFGGVLRHFTLGGQALYVPDLQTDPLFGPFMRIDTMPDLPV